MQLLFRFVAIYLIVCLSYQADAQTSKSGAISIKVIDVGNNKPITFAMAEVRNLSPKNNGSSMRTWGRLSINGNNNPAILKNLKPGGDYQVHAWASGVYKEEYRNHIWVGVGQTTNVTIYLYRKNGLIPAPPPPPAPSEWHPGRMKKK